jgi:hypothetical protein
MNSLKAIWKYLDGKKSNIALMYWTGTSLFLPIWFAAGLPHPWDKVNLTVGTLLTALGLGHKYVKSIGEAK